MQRLSVILVLLAFGCNSRPYSKDYIFTQSDDSLPLKSKVAILKQSSSVNDDALLAAIAVLYAQNKNWSEAKSSIIRAIKINPLEPSYHLYLANYNAELEEDRQAYLEAKIANELKAYDVRLEALLARMAIETNDTVGGASFVRKYYVSNPQNPEAQLLMARLSLFENNITVANRFVTSGLSYDSLNEQGWNTAFSVYVKMNNIPQAIKSGKRLIKLDSTNVNYYNKLAALYEKTDDLGHASYYYIKSYKARPDKEILSKLISNYGNRALYDSVLVVSDSTFARSYYQNKEVLLNRARALDKRYKFDESFAVYAQLLKRDSTDSVVGAEQAIVQRKIAYLQRKKREQLQLADSLANSLPTINF